MGKWKRAYGVAEIEIAALKDAKRRRTAEIAILNRQIKDLNSRLDVADDLLKEAVLAERMACADVARQRSIKWQTGLLLCPERQMEAGFICAAIEARSGDKADTDVQSMDCMQRDKGDIHVSHTDDSDMYDEIARILADEGTDSNIYDATPPEDIPAPDFKGMEITGFWVDEAEGINAAKPTTDAHVEEGGLCPQCKSGILELPPVENCSCHISPPCGACISNKLTCNACGWTPPEEKVECWPDTAIPNAEPNPWWQQYQEAFKRGHTFPHGGRVFEVTHDGSSGSTHVIEGRFEGPVTAQDIIDRYGNGTFGHRGPTLWPDREWLNGPALSTGRFTYTKITD